MVWNVESLNSRSFKSLERLKHVKALGFNPKVIFDVGAFVGDWAVQTRKIFSDSKFLLVEPNLHLKNRVLANLKGFDSDCVVEWVAAGEFPGKVKLNIWGNSKHSDPTVGMAASSLLPHVQGEPSQNIDVDLLTLDEMASRNNLWPDLLKLDLQGFELSALKGAARCLKSSELAVIEFGCLDAYEGRSTPNEVMTHMYGSGFVLYDIVGLIYRPYDGALVGGDFIFVKAGSFLKAHKDYF